MTLTPDRKKQLLLLLGAFLWGALMTLSDPDLSHHLAVGEWILRHHALPAAEPFAWTRHGPYFAYSWLADVMYFSLMHSFGPIGLHVLSGVIFLAAAAAALFLAESSNCQPRTALHFAALHLVVVATATPFLRPQQMAFVLMPLAWALVYRSSKRVTVGVSILAFATGMLAGNTHTGLLAPLIAVLALGSLAGIISGRRSFLLILLLTAGFTIGPNAPHLGAIYRLNLAPNLLLGHRSPIFELLPGLVVFWRNRLRMLAPVLLLALPLTLVRSGRWDRSHIVMLAAWALGLTGFVLAMRLLVVWWTLSLPLLVVALQQHEERIRTLRFSAPERLILALAMIMVPLAVVGTCVGDYRYESRTARSLPSTSAKVSEPLFSWLECNTKPGTSGLLLTEFNYGSYAEWRMPRLSPSIDGRTIFPDSVAVFALPGAARAKPSAAKLWLRADVAILDTGGWKTDSLKATPGWRAAARAGHVSLWVRDSWWQDAGRGSLPIEPDSARFPPQGRSCSIRMAPGP